MRKTLALIMAIMMVATLFVACGKNSDSTTATSDVVAETTATDTKEAETTAPVEKSDVTLSMMVSQGWLDDKDYGLIDKFTEETGIQIDVQVTPADQYHDLLKSKLTSGSTTDLFWSQVNPFAIKTELIDPASYCMDFTDASWGGVMNPARLPSVSYESKVYGLMLWHNSPEFVMVYNKTLFTELGITKAPTTYAELVAACEIINAKSIIPWFVPGADGWQHQLAFFQIGGVYEEVQKGLYEALNTNKAKFQDNAKMLEVLNQMKELSDKNYFGKDWIGSDSTNINNIMGERQAAMTMANPGQIAAIKEATSTTDEFGLFLIPLGDNQNYPTNPSGPAMFASKDSKYPEEVKMYYDFLTKQENLQIMLDNSPTWTNIDVTLPVEQHWMPEEEELMTRVDKSKMNTPVLQTGVKYVNEQWMDVGKDMISYFMGQMSDKDVLINMDERRAEMAKVQGNTDWAQ